jgi:hypothetical protein
MDIIGRIHHVSKQIQPAQTTELYDLMGWPTKEDTDPKAFYAGGQNALPGKRPVEGWFESQGYEKHKTTYTYAAGPDKCELTAAFYIPLNLESNTEVPIMWFFHGGGFVSP